MKVGQLARLTGTSAETIRYYERIGLLRPPERTASNYRSYGKKDVERLVFIRRARGLGFSIQQVRELLGLADDPSRPCSAVDEIARTHEAEVERKIAELGALRLELQRLIGQCGQGRVSTCRIIEALAGAEGAGSSL